MLISGDNIGNIETESFVKYKGYKQVIGSLPISWLLDSLGASTELLVCQGVLQNRSRYVGARVIQFDQQNKGLTCWHFSSMLWSMDAHPAEVPGEATEDVQQERWNAGLAIGKRDNMEDGGPPGAALTGRRGAADDVVEDRGRNGPNGSFCIGDMFVCSINLIVELMHLRKTICTKYSTTFNHDKSDAQIGGHFNWPPIRFKFEHFVFLLNLDLRFLFDTTSNYTIVKSITPIECMTARHLDSLCRIALRDDIEPNPGPKESIREMTINCRGLGKINKFRHLLNRAYEIIAKGPAIVFLQETMIIDSQYLNIAWQGKYVHTAGLGNSQGCITLLNDSVSISDIVHVGHRAHTFTVKGLIDTEVMVANVYAPIGLR